ncbi:hypothetical protein BGX30_014095 [Mortierella sp. GBA39]|nr:hypothetical protein BGX30_014095 [Mortierella sp. GBA39]
MIEDKNEEWWKKDEDLAPVIRTHEILVNLMDLTLRGPRKFVWKPLSVLRSLFSNCPKLRSLNLNINIEARSIPLDNLSEHDPLGFRILGSLLPQQIIKFSYSGILSAYNIPTLNASVLQHSTSLREIRLTGADGHCYISASAILKECRNLEKLCIPFLHECGLFIPLDDTLEHPWGCNKLTHLTFAISGCELSDESGVQPYYRRPTPITLTEDETQHFARLEELYRRIGG